MYKPGTQLILTDLWAAAAAHKLGFEAQSNPNNNKYVILNDIGWIDMFLPDARVWRITVTESGPNAAERFLPQMGDTVLAWCYPDADPQPPAMEVVHRLGDCDQDWCTFDVTPDGSQVKRIIERNGIPFPQFSEVIEP